MKTKFKWVGESGLKGFGGKIMKKGAVVSLNDHFAAKAMNLACYECIDVIEDAEIIEEPEVVEEPEVIEVKEEKPKKPKKAKLFV